MELHCSSAASLALLVSPIESRQEYMIEVERIRLVCRNALKALEPTIVGLIVTLAVSTGCFVHQVFGVRRQAYCDQTPVEVGSTDCMG